MDEKIKELQEAEVMAYFKAGLIEMSPESFTLKKEQQILADMRKTSSDIENALREDFSKLGKVTQTKLLDSLGNSS